MKACHKTGHVRLVVQPPAGIDISAHCTKRPPLLKRGRRNGRVGGGGHGRGEGGWELIAHDEEKRAAWVHLNRRCGVEGKDGGSIASGRDVI